MSKIAICSVFAAFGLSATDIREQPTSAEILIGIEGFRTSVLRDSTPLNVCKIDAFWDAAGMPVDQGRAVPGPHARKSECTTPATKLPVASIESIKIDGDSVVVQGSTRHGGIARAETYVYVVKR